MRIFVTFLTSIHNGLLLKRFMEKHTLYFLEKEINLVISGKIKYLK